MSSTYIVTGAAGYIGSVLCKRLKEIGHKIVAVDLNAPRHNYYDTLITANYADEARLAVHVKYADGIFHLAASSLLNPSLEDPLSYYQNNVSSFYSFLRTITNYNPKIPFVFASSAAVYGESSSICWAGSTSCNPINPYGFTKLQAEQALDDITKYTGAVPHISFRFFNVAGGYGDVGHDIDRPALLTSLSRAVINKKAFTRYGNNHRDYIHVLDICSAMMVGMESIKSDTRVSLNLCSGELTPTSTVVDLFKFFTKTEFEVIESENRAGDPEILKGDNHYTKSYLSIGRSPWGWRPENSNWKNIIESHWEFVKYDRNL